MSDTRARILAAAANEFLERGYADATTRGIAALARVNEVTLFRHFGSKRELLERVVEEMADRHPLDDALSSGLSVLPTREGLLNLGRRWAATMQMRADWLRLQWAERAGPPEGPSRGSVGFRDRLADYIRTHQEQGIFRPDVDASTAAEVFLVAIAGFALARSLIFTDRPGAPVEAFLETEVDLFLAGLEVR